MLEIRQNGLLFEIYNPIKKEGFRFNNKKLTIGETLSLINFLKDSAETEGRVIFENPPKFNYEDDLIERMIKRDIKAGLLKEDYFKYDIKNNRFEV